MESHKKRGRPKTGNAKEIVLRCRISDDLHKRLTEYCERNNVTKTEVITKGVESVIKG